MTKGATIPGPPADYKPKRGGAPQTWNPTVNVRVAMTGDDAAYFKARMDEQLADREEVKK
jgi:hypothetical protein